MLSCPCDALEKTDGALYDGHFIAEIDGNLEKQQMDVGGRPRLAEHAGEPSPANAQLDLFRGQGELVLDAIGRVDVDAITPLAALQLLASLQHRLRGEE